MNISPSNILPKLFPSALRQQAEKIQVSPVLVESSASSVEPLLVRFGTALSGLTSEQAAYLLEQRGPNAIASEQKHGWRRLLRNAVLNPLVILLTVIGVVAFLTQDYDTAVIISLMVVLGLVLRFVQEYRADVAAAKLRAMIHITTTVLREGTEQDVPVSQVVPGDIVKLAAGDMIPADIRILSCKDLFIVQSSLTGESLPVEKFDTPVDGAGRSPLELHNVCFLGTSVESGSATAIVIATGFNTYLGRMAKAITAQQPPTSFDRGIQRFTWLMIRYILVMVPLVFLINGFTKGNWHEAFFFALAVAVGLTPEMLPMIVTVCLSKGALAMSKKKVIIKRLHSIQNL